MIWILSSHNCWKYLPKMLRTMRASWPIARTTANQKSVVPGTRDLREEEKCTSSEKHRGVAYSRAKCWPNWKQEQKGTQIFAGCLQRYKQWLLPSQIRKFSGLTALFLASPHTHSQALACWSGGLPQCSLLSMYLSQWTQCNEFFLNNGSQITKPMNKQTSQECGVIG